MDVFSAGVTLAYAAKLKSVWAGDNQDAITESIKNDKPDLTGLTPLQEEFIRPLFEKLPIDRPKSASVHKKALEYIEYLVDKEHKSKPVALRVKKSFSRRLRNPRVKWGVPIGLVSAMVIASLLPGQLIPNEIKSWFTNTPTLTIAQLEKASSCAGLVFDGEFQIASNVCRETAELGHADSQHALGYALDQLGNNREALFWMRKAAAQKVPLSLSWLAYDAIEKEEYSEALELAKQSAEFGEIDGIAAVGLAYGYLEQYELAAEWYEKVWTLGDAWGLINLGYHYRFDDPNEIEAEKWLKLAATTPSKYESEGAFDYAEFLREQGKGSAEFCPWYKKSADAKYKEDEFDAAVSFKKYCSGVESTPTPVASPTVKNRLPKPGESKKPITESNSFKVSAPLALNVQVEEIFGRAFKSGLDWKIPLTNVKSEKVPELTAIQFRMIGYANAGWMDVPHKLKTDSSRGTVYAEVDDLLFALVFKEVKYCPEFRAVREEGGKLVNIWTKGQPECSNE